MNVSLRPVTVANRGDLDDINPGDTEKYWVHSNWYWHQQSLDRPTITFRLVHIDDTDAAVGMIAFGPAYLDEALLTATPGEYEITHLVIDKRFQGRGIGRIVATAALNMLLALPDTRRVVVAANPKNDASRRFFASLGFVPVNRANYDGDPMAAFEKPQPRPV